jgi:hypothetical protein
MTVPRALAPDANERSEDKPGASYIWALVIGSMIEEGFVANAEADKFSVALKIY